MALAGYVGLAAGFAEMPALQGFLLLLEGVSQLLNSCMVCRGLVVRVSLAPLGFQPVDFPHLHKLHWVSQVQANRAPKCKI